MHFVSVDSTIKKNPAAVALGRRGGKAGHGPAKSRAAQLRDWWTSPAGQEERERRKADAQAKSTVEALQQD